jgi:hypothetical protein
MTYQVAGSSVSRQTKSFLDVIFVMEEEDVDAATVQRL